MPPRGRIEVDERYCKGCGLCVRACPSQVMALAPSRLTAQGHHPVELTGAGCTGCGVCAQVCPEAALSVYRSLAAGGAP